MNFIAVPRDIQSVERFDRAIGLATRGAKRGEIMMADQRLRRIVHGTGI